MTAAVENHDDLEATEVGDDVMFDLGGFSEDEIRASSGRMTMFTASMVAQYARRVDAAGIVPLIEQWRQEDSYGRAPGGRPPLLNDRMILIASMLLMREESPLLVTNLRDLFWRRLDHRGRDTLGISHLKPTDDDDKDAYNWYFRVWRALHRLIDTIDAWPVEKRQLMTLAERNRQFSLRDQNMVRLKKERNKRFTNTMLEMTLNEQPEELRTKWQGALSIDQTSIRAPSQRKPWGRNKKTREEMPRFNPKTREEMPRHMLEIDAIPYPADKSAPNKDHTTATDGKSGSFRGWPLSYMGNIMMQAIEDPSRPAEHPQLIIAGGLGRIGGEVSEHTISAIDSVLERGHKITRLTADRGYNGGMKKENFHLPMKERGIPLVVDYKSTQRGIMGQTAGAIQVEGAHYCPAMPKNLIQATVDVEAPKSAANNIDPETYYKRIDERVHYKLRRKEKPDADGNVPMMCPAVGPNATVECPLKELHNKAPDKPRPVVLKRNLPAVPDKICTQTSVKFAREDGIETEQALHYGSREWHEIYEHDRNSIESINAYLKTGPERMDESAGRRVRGLAAQSYIFTIMMVTTNLRRIAKFMNTRRKAQPKTPPIQRSRDRNNLTNYRRWYDRVDGVFEEELPPAEPAPALRT